MSHGHVTSADIGDKGVKRRKRTNGIYIQNNIFIIKYILNFILMINNHFILTISTVGFGGLQSGFIE